MSLIPAEFPQSCCLTYDPWDTMSSMSKKMACFCQQTVRCGQMKFLLIDDLDELTDGEQTCISQCYDFHRSNVRIIATSSASHDIVPELQHRLKIFNVRYPPRQYLHRLVRSAWKSKYALSARSIDCVLDSSQNSLHAIYASLDKLFLLDTELPTRVVSDVLIMIEDEKVKRLLVSASAGRRVNALADVKTLLDSGVCSQDILASVGTIIEKSDNFLWKAALADAVLFFAHTKSASGAVYHLALTLFSTENAK